MIHIPTSESSMSLINFAALVTSPEFPPNVNMQGTSRPPRGKSLEYLHLPVILDRITPCLLRNNEQMEDIFQGTWPTVIPSFRMATASGSWRLEVSRWHCNTSPSMATQKSLDMVASNNGIAQKSRHYRHGYAQNDSKLNPRNFNPLKIMNMHGSCDTK